MNHDKTVHSEHCHQRRRRFRTNYRKQDFLFLGIHCEGDMERVEVIEKSKNLILFQVWEYHEAHHVSSKESDLEYLGKLPPPHSSSINLQRVSRPSLSHISVEDRSFSPTTAAYCHNFCRGFHDLMTPRAYTGIAYGFDNTSFRHFFLGRFFYVYLRCIWSPYFKS